MDYKKQALQRIKITQGHLEKVKKMLEEDCYCPDIIHQSQAVQSALKKFDEVILEGHLECCVFDNKKGNQLNKKKLSSEIMSLFKKGVR